jgi:hypothetical protein
MLDCGEMLDGVTAVDPTFTCFTLGVGSALVVVLTNFKLVAVISVVTPINSSFGIGLGIEVNNFIDPESSYQHLAFQRLLYSKFSKAITYSEVLANESSGCKEHEEKNPILDDLFGTMQA